MAVMPFRRPEIVRDPEPDPRSAKITVADDGSTQIEIGSTSPRPPRRQRSRGNFDENLAEDMDDTALQALAAYLLEAIEADEAERQEWVETVNRTVDFLGIKLKDPVSEVAADGTVCQAVATCLLEAAVKLWGTAYAELLPVGGPVKVEREDPVPVSQPQAPGGLVPAPANDTGAGPGGAAAPAPGGGAPPMGGILGADQAEPGQEPVTASDAKGDDLADALERDLNWYLTVGDRGYYPDFSKMLMNRNLVGAGFREVFNCPIERKPLSRFIMAQDVIVSGDPAHIHAARRYTLHKKVPQSTMRRMMIRGYYRDIPLVRPTGRTSQTEIVVGQTTGITPTPTLPRDFDHDVYQCHCELGSGTAHHLFGDLEMLDLDERGRDPGFPLPYRVEIDYDSKTVLSIRRDWKKGDPDYERKRRLVKYGFIPAFGGGLYDYGLIHLVGNPTQAATMLMRAGVDAALFANFPAWVMKQGPASKFESTTLRPGPGDLMKVAISGSEKLSDALMPFPYKEPSAQSMALNAKLESDVKGLAGLVDIPVGEGRIGNTPVGTIMSYIESVSMVPGAVHKFDHIAQAEEFEMLRELLAEEPQVLWRGNKNPAREWQVAEELMEPDISPKADPNTPSQYHRLLKIQGLIMLGGLPQFMGIADNRAIYRRAAEVLTGVDAAEFEMPEQPQGPAPPDPKIVAAQIKAQTEQQQEMGKRQEIALTHDAKMQELQLTSADKAADRLSAEKREAMKMTGDHFKTGADMVSEAVGHAHDQQQTDQQQAHEAQQQARQQVHEQQQSDKQQQADALLQPPAGGSES